MINTLVSARRALELGEISSVELVRSQLLRAESVREKGAFITLLGDEAIEEAKKMDAARQRGELFGSLHGIPITAKDIINSKGVRTTSGSKIYSNYVPQKNASCLQSLEESGAILLGKTNLHEFAFGVTNVNPHYGPAKNPWASTDVISGGSSGGSAVALASGVGFGSLGSDTGGSIRIPSALCGTVGLKPTFGAISCDGVTPLSWSLDHIGPMARTVKDIAILYEVLTGENVSDELNEPVSGLKLGFPERYFFENIASDIASAVDIAIGDLEGLGLTTVAMNISEIEAQANCRNTIAFSEAASFHAHNVRSRPEDYGSDTLELFRLGLLIPASEYVTALRARGPIIKAFYKAFNDIDVMVTPATADVAPPIGAEFLGNGETLRGGLLRMASPFNTTGFPALTLPCGFTEEGLPIGLQLVAKPGNEKLLLRLAYAYEQSHEWWLKSAVI